MINNNQWITDVLGERHQIIIFMSFDKESAELLGEANFKIGIHPALRHVTEELFDKILDALDEGVERLRCTPLDDLGMIRQ